MQQETDHHVEAERHRRTGEKIAARLSRTPDDPKLRAVADFHSVALALHEFHAKPRAEAPPQQKGRNP